MMERFTEQDWQALQECGCAEARGDAQTALRLQTTTPYGGQALHTQSLREVVRLGSEAPGWVICRWIAQQAYRWVVQHGDPRVDDAMVVTLGAAYGEVDLERPLAMEPADFTRAVIARDWVCEQIALFDLGGLASYVEEVIGPDLRRRAPSVDQWAEAPVGGYALRALVDSKVLVTDLATGDSLELLNLGISWSLDPGTCVIGRVVASGSTPGLMFASRPLPVDGLTARQVASGAGDSWLGPLTSAAAAGSLPPGATQQPPASLVCDLAGGAPTRLKEAGNNADTAEAGARLCVSVLELVAEDAQPAAHLAPCVLGVLLDPEVLALLRATSHGGSRRDTWHVVAAPVPQPFRQRCLELALLWGEQSAA